MTGSEEIDAHIAALPADRRKVMERIRELVTSAAPDAEEVIAYQMPSLRLKGKYLLSYESFKDHYGLYPATTLMSLDLGEEVQPYVKGKGTLQFKAGEPLPEALITKVVKVRLRDFA